MLNSSLYVQEDLEQDNGHFSVLVQRKSGILSVKIVHKVNGTKWLNFWWSHSERGDIPVFRATSPLSRGQLKCKGGGKLSIHYCADQEPMTTVFRTITLKKSAQSSRSSRRNVWRIWILSRGKTPCGRTVEFLVRAECDQHKRAFWTMIILQKKELLLQRYGERIEKLSQQGKLSKFCMDSGFLNVVEIGQYFMTKDTA